jgi:TPR repeat protein
MGSLAIIGGGLAVLLALIGLIIWLMGGSSAPPTPVTAQAPALDDFDDFGDSSAAPAPAPLPADDRTARSPDASNDFDDEFDDFPLAAAAAADEPEQIRQLRLSASEGDASAAFRLGKAFYDGDDIEQSKRTALAWFKQAALSAHQESQFLAGRMLIQGDGVDANVQEGLGFLRQAAEQGHTQAEFFIGQLHYTGEHLQQDAAAAAEWFGRAAEKNHADALTQLGFMAMNGEGMEPNMQQGVVYLRRAADMGRPEGLEELKAIVREQAAEDVNRRFPPFERGAAMAVRRSNGQVVRGTFFRQHEGVVTLLLENRERVEIPLGDVDIATRIRLDDSFRELMIRGRVEEDLATEGTGARRTLDISKLRTLDDWIEAGWRGFPEAQRYVGLAHLHGRDTLVDYPTSFIWMRIAAIQGDADAQYHLGLMYFRGRGAPPNESTGLGWISRAAEQNHPQARQALDQYMAARANQRQLLEEIQARRQEEMEHHSRRLQEIRGSPEYGRLGMRPISSR